MPKTNDKHRVNGSIPLPDEPNPSHTPRRRLSIIIARPEKAAFVPTEERSASERGERCPKLPLGRCLGRGSGAPHFRGARATPVSGRLPFGKNFFGCVLESRFQFRISGVGLQAGLFRGYLDREGKIGPYSGACPWAFRFRLPPVFLLRKGFTKATSTNHAR